MKVVEIFKSIDGEGIRTGLPVTFIRLFGCNLRCSYCDTKYSYDDAPYTEMSVEQILAACIRFDVRRITLTGGEPLIHAEVRDLIGRLLVYGFEVNVETNGSIDLKEFEDLHTKLHVSPNLFYTMDYKSPSSGMCGKNKLSNFQYLRPKDVLKFVVGSEEDLQEMLKILTDYSIEAQVFVSPVFGKIEPSRLVEFVLDNELDDVRVQVQLHKIIWDPEKRGV